MWPTPTQDAATERTKKYAQGGKPLTMAVQEQEKQQMYPTPTERDWKGGHGTLVKKDGKYYRVSKTTGTKFGARLDAVVEKEHEEQQKLWPTPTTQEIEHPNAELTATGRRKTKDGNDSHSLGLADQVQLYPTPNARDWKDTLNSKPNKQEHLLDRVRSELYPTPVAHEARLGYQRRDTGKKGTQKSLTTIVIDAEGGRELYPTPTSRDWRSGKASENTHKRNSRPLNEMIIKKQKATKAQLNPGWVTALMGFPRGWTDPGNTDSNG